MGRLIFKTLDIFGVAEGSDFLGQVFKPKARTLNPMEEEEARMVFGDGFPYEKVRIDERAWLARLGRWLSKSEGMGVVVGYTVHFSRKIYPSPGNRDMRWLIHELTHVAQVDAIGLQYIPESLVAQRFGGYDYGGLEGLVGKDLREFNREQQGDICADYYKQVLYGSAPATDFERLIVQVRKGEF